MLLLLWRQMWLVTFDAVLFWGDMSQDRTDLGNYCGRARFCSTSSLDGLPALSILFTWRKTQGTVSIEEKRMCSCALQATAFSQSTVCAGGDFLPSFSTGEVACWLGLGTDWVHFTLSAQLGPVWDSRAAASVAGGPLNKMHTHIMHENKQMRTCTVKPYVSAGKILNFIMPLHLISEQPLQCSLSKTLQQSEDSAYLTPQHSPLWDSMGLYWTTGLRHDQYPFPAASDYRALHILNGCFSSL